MKKKLLSIVSLLCMVSGLQAQETNEAKAAKEAVRAFKLISYANGQSNVSDPEYKHWYLTPEEANHLNLVDKISLSNPMFTDNSVNVFGVPISPSMQTSTFFPRSPRTFTTSSLSANSNYTMMLRILDDAILILKDCEKLDPASNIYPLQIGFAYYLQKDYKKAIKKLMRLQYAPETNERVFRLLAKCYIQKNDDDNALKTIEKGMGIFPKSGALHQEQGLYYLQKKDTASALESFETGIRIQPSFAPLYEITGLVHQWQNRPAESLAYYEVFMNLEPANPRFRLVGKRVFNLSRQLFSLKNPVPRQLDDTSAIGFSYLDEIVDQMYSKGYMDTTVVAKTPVAKRLKQYKTDVVKQGFASEYLHWLLQQSNIREYEAWKMERLNEWNVFAKWFNDYNGFTQAVERRRKPF